MIHGSGACHAVPGCTLQARCEGEPIGWKALFPQWGRWAWAPISSTHAPGLTARLAGTTIRCMATRYRDEAWHGLLDAERLARYHGALAAGLLRRQRLLDAVVAFGATGAVASMLAAMPRWASVAVAAVVALAALWSLLTRPGEAGAKLAPAAEELERVASRWRFLWHDIDALGDDEARHRIEELWEAMERCTRGAASLPERRRLNERCAGEANTVMLAQYDAAP